MPPLSEESAEAVSVAYEMERAYQSEIKRLIQLYPDMPERVYEEAGGPYNEQTRLRVMSAKPEFSDWQHLNRLRATSPALADERWEIIKTAALARLRSGHVAAQAVEGEIGSTPWQRAQFLALRTELARGLGPLSGMEQTMVDQMALAHHLFLYWTMQLHQANMLGVMMPETDDQQRSIARSTGARRGVKAATLDEDQMVSRAAAMADRFQRMFLRTQRALRDMRRFAPSVVVQNAEQVNVANQQVNLSQKTSNDFNK